MSSLVRRHASSLSMVRLYLAWVITSVHFLRSCFTSIISQTSMQLNVLYHTQRLILTLSRNNLYTKIDVLFITWPINSSCRFPAVIINVLLLVCIENVFINFLLRPRHPRAFFSKNMFLYFLRARSLTTLNRYHGRNGMF